MGERIGKYTKQDAHFTIHPDIRDATQNYKGIGGNNTFKKTFEFREQMLANDEEIIYWDSDHDIELAETARERTQVAAAKGWKMPKRR